MKKFVFLKFASMAAIVTVISLFFLVGCAEDPAGNSSSGGGGGDDNGGGGNPGVSVSRITLKNGTGYTISGIYVKLSTSTDWGNNLYGYSSLSDGQTREITFSQPLSTGEKYDIRLSQSSNGGDLNFRKYNLSIDGRTIVFSTADLNDGSNLPSISIQNRTGVRFDAIYIRPSSMPESSSDWGRDYGSLSNNSDQSVTIPIPPSNYTSFDIKVKSSNPTNTYTKRVTVSNGMVVTYTSADSDNPTIGNPIIVIDNSTGYSISGIYIKPSTSTDWGNNLYDYSTLSDGRSRTFTLSQPIPIQNVYDIRLSQSSNGGDINFRKYKFTVSDGMIITFTVNDLNDGSDLPTITIQNRVGIAFNSLHIKPSISSDWDSRNFGSISNNNNLSVTIPIPPSNYNIFDIQTRSTNPANTYTMRNITITDGMVLTFTRVNSDNSLIGNPIIVIENNTGYSISGIWIKSSDSDDWGSNLYNYNSLSDGGSRTFDLSQSTGSIDIRLGTSSSITSGNQFVKSNLSISDGMIVTFTGNDLQ